jgi:hypothetical protein
MTVRGQSLFMGLAKIFSQLDTNTLRRFQRPGSGAGCFLF